MLERGRYGGCEVHDWCEDGNKGACGRNGEKGGEREREREGGMLERE